ncbi:putative fanconi anemia protein FANCD2 [Helianthus annuus]|nr:putative fanconi anemia protein FANCD2 [Helianthus annuus]
MLTCPDLILSKQSSLLDLLKSFQLKKVNHIEGMQSLSSTGDVFCLYGGVFEFLESVLDTGMVKENGSNVSKSLCFSFMLASEVVVTLESVVISLQKVIDKPLEGTTKHKTAVAQELLVTSRNKLCSSAHKVLSHDWHDIENGWKGKGEMVQKIVHIYLENCESTSQSLDELACSILPTVSLSSRTTAEDYSHGFTTLCSSTFSVWYKELHEQNLVMLGKLVRHFLSHFISHTYIRSRDI